jgi:hypothetical protein
MVVVAALFAFVGTRYLPPGLYRDEAYYGLDRWMCCAGRRALFRAITVVTIVHYLEALGWRLWDARLGLTYRLGNVGALTSSVFIGLLASCSTTVVPIPLSWRSPLCGRCT